MKNLLEVLREQDFENVQFSPTPSATAENAKKVVEAVAFYLNEQPAVLSTDLECAIRALAKEGVYVVDPDSFVRSRLDACIPRLSNGRVGNSHFSERKDMQYLYLPNVLYQLQQEGRINNMTLCLRIPEYTDDQKIVFRPGQELIDVARLPGPARRSTEWVYFKDKARMQDYLVRRIEEDMAKHVTVTIEPRI